MAFLDSLRHVPSCSFQWDDCDVDSDQTLAELHELLSLHYVEDDENMFRCVRVFGLVPWSEAGGG